VPEDERDLIQAYDRMFPSLIRNLLQHLTREARLAGLTLAQFYLLRQLRSEGPWTAAQVGDALGITSGPVSSMTKRMIAQGLLRRRADRIDRRVAWFSVTQRGQEILAATEGRLQLFWGRVIRELGTGSASDLLDLLNMLAAALGRMQTGDETAGAQA
jgi:DNA-binding MarR family transcriptional regulator